MAQKTEHTAEYANKAALLENFRIQWRILFLVLAIVAGVVGYQQYSEHRTILTQEEQRLQTQAKVVASNVERQLIATSLTLESLVKDVSSLRGSEDSTQVNRRLQMLSDAMPGIRTIFILDVEGTIVNSNREELIGRNFRARDYFATPEKENNPSKLYVSPPFKSVLGNYLINVSRVIPSSNGAFNGVVSAALSPAYFKVLLDSVLYAPDMQSSIVHGDGVRFMMVPDQGRYSGANLNVPGTFYTRHKASVRHENMFIETSPSYTTERIMAVHTVQPESLTLSKPLYINCSREYPAIFKQWWSDALLQALLFVLLCFAGVFGLTRLQKRQRVLEENLQKVMQQQALILENASVGISFVVDRKQVWSNQRMSELFGYLPEEMENESTRICYPSQETYEHFGESAYPVLVGGNIFKTDYVMMKKNGTLFWARICGKAIAPPDLSKGSIWTFEDISELKAAEETLRESEMSYRTIFESSADALSIIDPETGMIIDCNEAAVKLHDAVTRNRLIGSTLDKLSPEYQEDGERSSKRLPDHIHRVLTFEMETFDWMLCKSDGSIFPAMITLCAIQLKGKTNKMAICRDFSERKQIENDLKESKQQLANIIDFLPDAAFVV
ncbi:MAG: PAS domain S-box protein, partial [Desulfuromonadaceae bacterium]|nr:PAS domain S-box protein [Desulfuromonadaceae bacterium]